MNLQLYPKLGAVFSFKNWKNAYKINPGHNTQNCSNYCTVDFEESFSKCFKGCKSYALIQSWKEKGNVKLQTNLYLADFK